MVEKKVIEYPKVAELIKVTTQTAPAIRLPDGTIINELDLLVRIYNKIINLEKVLA